MSLNWGFLSPMPRAEPLKCSFQETEICYFRPCTRSHGKTPCMQFIISLALCSDYEGVTDEFAITKGVCGPKSFRTLGLRVRERVS